MSNDKGEGLFLDVKSEPAKGPSKPASKPPAGGGSGAPKLKNVKMRWLYVGVAAIALVIAVSTMTHTAPPPVVRPEKAGQLINVTPTNIDQAGKDVKNAAALKEEKDRNDKLASDLRAMEAQIQMLKDHPNTVVQKLPPGITGPPSADNSITSGTGPVVGPPPVNPVGVTPVNGTIAPINKGASVPSINGGVVKNPVMPLIPPPFSSTTDSQSSAPSEVMVFMPDKSVSRPPLTVDGDAVDAKVRYKKNTQNGLMVAGAFAPVVLLNGIEAGTSSGSRSNPLPVLIRVQDNAQLPGAAKYQLKSCFMLGSGYGDLSAERVYIRLARLSCVDRDDRLVLSVPLQGYLVDSDNVLGMRGKVVDRQGARLGKAMLAGFAQGLSGALGSSQGDVTTSALGAATSITGTAALRASGLSGVSSASSQLASFYLKEAEAIFPVIEVEGGRLASVVVSEDTSLAWGNVDEQFVREVTPTNK